MLTVTLKGVLAHKLRVLLTALFCVLTPVAVIPITEAKVGGAMTPG